MSDLTVGELARLAHVSVRTLHHYDAIGLLKPSLRSDARYRLYDRANVERLHRIQALRQLGLSLADIGTVLSGPEQPLAEVIDRQIAQPSSSSLGPSGTEKFCRADQAAMGVCLSFRG